MSLIREFINEIKMQLKPAIRHQYFESCGFSVCSPYVELQSDLYMHSVLVAEFGVRGRARNHGARTYGYSGKYEGNDVSYFINLNDVINFGTSSVGSVGRARRKPELILSTIRCDTGPFRLVVIKRDGSHFFSDMFFSEAPLFLGDQNFENQFRIDTSYKQLAVRFLTPEMRELLTEVKDLSFEIRNGVVYLMRPYRSSEYKSRFKEDVDALLLLKQHLDRTNDASVNYPE